MLINSLNQSYISAKRIKRSLCRKAWGYTGRNCSKRNFLEPVLTSWTLELYLPRCCSTILAKYFFCYATRTNSWNHRGGLALVNQVWYRSYLAFYTADKGAFPFIEMDVCPRNLSEWQSWMAYVPQKVELFKGTIRSNLTLGMEEIVSDQELWQALEIAKPRILSVTRRSAGRRGSSRWS